MNRQKLIVRLSQLSEERNEKEKILKHKSGYIIYSVYCVFFSFYLGRLGNLIF